jgi:hypothetical protein
LCIDDTQGFCISGGDCKFPTRSGFKPTACKQGNGSLSACAAALPGPAVGFLRGIGFEKKLRGFVSNPGFF